MANGTTRALRRDLKGPRIAEWCEGEDERDTLSRAAAVAMMAPLLRRPPLGFTAHVGGGDSE